ncbi:hypothetical protein [Jiangella endophytica]|uniref:hypothetical protein n=1 Tax=Jiangella endophytica TaxID=1623398 RepID=UPI000E349524|nr:hypothetical protein [Jiangella endophytica]
MFIDLSVHFDQHAERRATAAGGRTRRALVRTRRLRRWAARSARLAAQLDRRASERRPAVTRLSNAA